MLGETDAKVLALYDRALGRQEMSDGTRYKRRNTLRRFQGLLAGRPLLEATTKDVEAYLDATKRAGCEARTRASYLADLRSFYGWAVDAGLIEASPALSVRRPRSPRTLPRPTPTAQLQLALSEAGPMVRCWLTLAAYGGLRCMEIAGLDRQDVLVEQGLIRIYGKGSKERLVPLHPATLAALRALPMPASGPLFRRARCLDRYPAWQLSQELNAYLHGLGIAHTAHSLRHWFGSELYRQTRDLRLVQDLLGHESPTTTAIYTAWDREGANDAVLALGSPA